MLRVLRRRLLLAVPLLLGVVVMNFLLIQAAPGTLLDVITADQQITDAATLARLRHTFGVDQPVWLQLLHYIAALAQGDFGFSYRQNMPVLQAILQRLPATLLLMLAALGIALVLGVAAGILAASKVRTLWDTLVSGTGGRVLRRAQLLARHHADHSFLGAARLAARWRHARSRCTFGRVQ